MWELNPFYTPILADGNDPKATFCNSIFKN